MDRAGIYRSDDEPAAEQLLAGQRPATQFGRAMRDLGVAPILANSPQAKGRVERANRTPQDRLVKALRLAGVSTIGAANALPDGSSLAAFNGKFRVDPAGEGDGHRALGGALPAGADLSDVLCEHEERAVGRDWCVQWRGRLLQVERAHEPLALPGKRVTVREKADGSVQVSWRGQPLSGHPVERRPRRAKAKTPVVSNKRWVPPADHPWKKRPPADNPAPAARASSAAPPRPMPPGRGQGDVR